MYSKADTLASSSTEKLFGHLEKCSHVFCVRCIFQWNQSRPSGEKSCPNCRLDGTRILVWPTLRLPDALKNILFSLQIANGFEYEVERLLLLKQEQEDSTAA